MYVQICHPELVLPKQIVSLIVNTSTISVEDPVITIGSNTADDNLDRGVEFKYNDGSAKVGFMGWDDSASRFVLLKDATNTNEVFTGTDADLQAAKGLFSGDIVVGGNGRWGWWGGNG